MPSSRELLNEEEEKLFRSLSKIYRNIKRDIKLELPSGRHVSWTDIQRIYRKPADDAVRSAVTSMYLISARKTVEKDIRIPFILTEKDMAEIRRYTQKYQDWLWVGMEREIVKKTATAYDPRTFLRLDPSKLKLKDTFIGRMTESLHGEVAGTAVLSKARQVVGNKTGSNGRRSSTRRPLLETQVLQPFKRASIETRSAQFSEPHLVWRTAEDEATCFPAYTLVKTSKGDKFIKDIKVNDLIATRKGYRKCKAVSKRLYSKRMNSLTTNKGLLVSTSNHLIWTVNRGWIESENILCSHDALQSFTDELVQVHANIDFSLSQSDKTPSILSEICSLIGISTRVSMPIGTVHFKHRLNIWKSKITRVSTNLHFLDKVQVEPLQRFSDFLFKIILPLKASITCKGTEESSSLTLKRSNPEHLITSPTLLQDRGSSTLFRAIYPIIPINTESFSTSPTVNISGIGESTFTTADSISTIMKQVYNEEFATDWTEFSDLSSRLVSPIALYTTEFLTPINSREGQFSFASTSVTYNYPVRLSFIDSFRRFISQYMTKWQVIYHALFSKPMYVYNIEVNKTHEFYANDILVHNCEICAPLEGRVFAIDDPAIITPVEGTHPRCRCELELVDASETQEINSIEDLYAAELSF